MLLVARVTTRPLIRTSTVYICPAGDLEIVVSTSARIVFAALPQVTSTQHTLVTLALSDSLELHFALSAVAGGVGNPKRARKRAQKRARKRARVCTDQKYV